MFFQCSLFWTELECVIAGAREGVFSHMGNTMLRKHAHVFLNITTKDTIHGCDNK